MNHESTVANVLSFLYADLAQKLIGFVLGFGLAPYGVALPGLIYFLSGRWKTARLSSDTKSDAALEAENG